MMRRYLLPFPVAAMLFIGCSSASAPSSSYPITLSTVVQESSGNTAIFVFQVSYTDRTTMGAHVAGAKLRRTDYPSNTTRDLGIMSDSTGKFDTVDAILSDTLSQVAFQAVKDTLKSNYVRWP